MYMYFCKIYKHSFHISFFKLIQAQNSRKVAVAKWLFRYSEYDWLIDYIFEGKLNVTVQETGTMFDSKRGVMY